MSQTEFSFSKKQVEGFTFQGWLPTFQMGRIVKEAIVLIGMTPSGPPDVRVYPNLEGKGGKGYTLFQPLVESYCVADIYEDLNETKFLIASCKPFDKDLLGTFLGENIGLLMKQGGFEL